jgi:type IV pilus assembly protein PilZ
MARPGGAQPGILTLNIKDKSALYVSYMPFIKNGGLFIPTTRDSKLGDEVFLLPQDGGTTQKKIEGYLAGALGADRPTHTM